MDYCKTKEKEEKFKPLINKYRFSYKVKILS